MLSPEHGPLISPDLAPILTLGMVPVSLGLLQKLSPPGHRECREGEKAEPTLARSKRAAVLCAWPGGTLGTSWGLGGLMECATLMGTSLSSGLLTLGSWAVGRGCSWAAHGGEEEEEEPCAVGGFFAQYLTAGVPAPSPMTSPTLVGWD